MILTREIIMRGISKNGGFSAKQLSLLNETHTKGWLKRSIGKWVSDEVYDEFISLKNAHLKNIRQIPQEQLSL